MIQRASCFRAGSSSILSFTFWTFVFAYLFLCNSGCHRIKTVNRGEKSPTDGQRIYSANECNDLFPLEEENEYPITNAVFTPSEDAVVYTMGTNCHYDLGVFECSCKCNCTLDFIEIGDPAEPGDRVNMDLTTPSGLSYSGLTFIVDDQNEINLADNGYDVLVEEGLAFTIRIEGKDITPSLKVTAGGLCVVVNVEGGGN